MLFPRGRVPELGQHSIRPQRVEKIRIFHESMIKITKAYTRHIDYGAAELALSRRSCVDAGPCADVPLGDTIGDLTVQLGSSLGNLATTAASRLQGGEG